ncbi:phosphoenolpyruvate carboxylase [Acidothermaceae bacterium B102]|nr:phosphoenolpyruvate carboxylase [Acidothermaceae bacterium B102]
MAVMTASNADLPPSATAGRTTARHGVPPELRSEVRVFGAALGQVLRESVGPDLFDDVERLRRAVIDTRGGEPDAESPADIVAGFDTVRAEQVARAFTVYFQMANLAEERQRVRALRGRTASDRPDSFSGLVGRLEPDELAAMLPGLRVHPVLTAHPTEARRRAAVTAIHRVGEAIDLPDETARERRLLEEVTSLWRTAQLRDTKPGPIDEVRTAMAVFDESLFAMVPTVYRAFEAALSGPDAGTRPPTVPTYLRLGSWIGGDRDGNPNVTAPITREALDVQADHVLVALTDATERLASTLTLYSQATPPSAALRSAAERAADQHPALITRLSDGENEPHREYLLYVAARLAATRDRHADLAYRGADEFVADLRLLQDSLAAAGAGRIAYGGVQDLLWQAETFGFHLAELEVRQHSGLHTAALACYLGDEARNSEVLDQVAREGAGDPVTPLDDMSREVLSTIRAVAALQHRWGVRACHRYIISFTSRASDLVAVRALARIAVGDGPLDIDVIPLFETQEDLENSVPVLEEWLTFPSTKAHLAGNGRKVEIMLGYSDSAKDVGPVSATLSLYDAQAALADWAARNDIALTLFHGRGGAVGRGGGPAGRAILSGAPGSVAGRFKVTEQGEVILARYGTPEIAVRHLEQVTTSVLLASTPAIEARTAEAAVRFSDLALRTGAAAKQAYRSLVETDGFADFFAEVSPLEELGMLQIGSRPARRKTVGTGHDLASLRAIPWVFAWAQTRCNLPGWFGLGTGLAAAAAVEGGLDELRAAYASWPLFSSMLDNAEMSLAKADRDIAARYLALSDRSALAEVILAEFDLSVSMLLQVLQRDALLAGHRVLGWAVELRNPYVDALSHLQLRALTAIRAAEASGEELSARDAATNHDLLLLTVGGVAAGLQNTG